MVNASLRRPPSALLAGASGSGSGARRCLRPAVAISARADPRRRPLLPPRASATPGGSGSSGSDDLPDRDLPPSPSSSFPDLFGTDDPPPGPKAIAALLAELAAASTAAELQAALLSFLPRHMLEDAEEDDETEQQQHQRDWGAQWRAMTAAAGDQQKQQPPQDKGAAAETPPSPPPPPPSLPRALELMLRRPADEQPLDSFALRHLVLTRPRALEPLSAFSASASRYVQRVAVLGSTGERAVLTFTLARRGAGRRARRHAATAPTSCSAAAHWFLVRVEGEQGGGGGGGNGSADDDAAASSSSSSSSASSSELAPETVVALQLERLRRGDVDGAFSLTSPVGRAVAGDLPRFRHLLSSDARFKPVLKHGGWASLRRTQSIARSYVEVVAVRPAQAEGGGKGGKTGGASAKGGQQQEEEEEEAVYAVIASLHPADDEAGGERWLIDYFAPIRDPLLRTLLMGAARPTAD